MQDASKAQHIMQMKGIEKIAMLTAYDYSMAHVETLSGVDMILVGDSANFILNGKTTTRGITINGMRVLVERVARGVKDYGDHSLVVGDLPANTYDTVQDAVKNAKILWDAGADAVKLEGATEKPLLGEVICAIIAQGIPVQGHIGYTPQSESLVDKGFVQGKSLDAIIKLQTDYTFLEDAGVFSIVLECVPWQVAQYITKQTNVPTIGIGAGPHCDGQVLVVYDLLNLSTGVDGFGKMPKFVWQYGDISAPKAIERYVKDVKAGIKPSLSESFELKDPSLLDLLD